MSGTSPGPFRVSQLPQSRATEFHVEPDDAARRVLADRMELLDLRKVRFTGRIEAEGAEDWLLTGHLGATVVQPCTVTLEPVTTRIEEEVTRRFTPHLPDEILDDDAEVEMPEDETLEPLGETISPEQVLEEALALALPLYPRKETAELEQTGFTEPGREALTDDDVKPFAGLAGLKAKLEGKDD